MDKLFEMAGDIAMVHKKGIETGRKMILDRLPTGGELRTIIYKHTSEMLDNPVKYGIYPTAKFYNNLIVAIYKRQQSIREE